jgi:JmjC domain, hydroxylase
VVVLPAGTSEPWQVGMTPWLVVVKPAGIVACFPPFIPFCSQVPSPFSIEDVKGFFTNCAEDKEDPTASDPEVAKDVMLGRSDKYISLTLNLFDRVFAATLFAIRAWFPSGLLPSAKGITDVFKLTLILLGGSGTGTPFHLDYNEALNVAFAIRGSPDDVLAVWVCIAPFAIEAADAWLRRQKKSGAFLFPQGFATPGRVLLQRPLLERFVYDMNAHRVGSVMVVPQRHGEVVYMPPSWVHQVTNLQPVLKVAFDFYDPNHFGLYALVHGVASRFFKQNMSTDYAYINLIMEDILLKQL